MEFSKMFPQLQNINVPISQPIVTMIANAQASEIKHVSQAPAGLTYLGQLVSHDIVAANNRTVNSLIYSRYGVGKPQRKSNTALNLDSVYGTVKERKLLKIIDQDTGKFWLGGAPHSYACGDHDLLRYPDGVAIIPDQRNDENIIVAQLHLLWQKFHNHVIDNILAPWNPKKNFERARALTILTFQHVVVYDFLRTVLHPYVFEKYCLLKGQYFLQQEDIATEVPREFSDAAFRFGHAMVRQGYDLNQGTTVDSKSLFKAGSKISLVNEIDWKFFFGPETTHASSVNLLMAKDLSKLEVKHGIFNLIEADIRASNDLPSGVKLFSHIGSFFNEIYNDLNLPREDDLVSLMDMSNSTLRKSCNKALDCSLSSDYFDPHKLPLWLFILREAELFPVTDKIRLNRRNSDSAKMGFVGSTIVAEVLMQSIRRNSVSILRPREQNSRYLGKSLIPHYQNLVDSGASFGMFDVVKQLNC